jgi:hypothetical protein
MELQHDGHLDEDEDDDSLEVDLEVITLFVCDNGVTN